MEKTPQVSNEDAAEFTLTADNERELADILSRYPTSRRRASLRSTCAKTRTAGSATR
jgi:hypothetical protein